MTIATTKPFLDEHSRMRGHVEHLPLAARELPSLGLVERVELVERVVAFVAEVLLPHAMLEERVLYPEAARLLGEADASDTIHADRAVVRDLLGELAEVDASDTGELQELFYALYLTLTTHLQKEEEVYVKLLGSRRQERVVDLLTAMTFSRTVAP